LLLAKADQPDFVILDEIDLEAFLEDVFMRWSEVAPRTWKLGRITDGLLAVDPQGLRCALDALLENAVKYTDTGDEISLSSRRSGSGAVIEVEDSGCGIPEHAFSQIWDRFARADAARSRAQGGVGLGLAIVDAIAKAHGGRCSVRVSDAKTTFALFLPRFRAPLRMPAAMPSELLRNS
jgi:two-component system, OmpR family, sensor kinase